MILPILNIFCFMTSFKNTIFRNSMGNLLKLEDENCVLLIIFKCSESFIAKTDLFYLNYR